MFISKKIKEQAVNELENLKKSKDGFVLLSIGKSSVLLIKEGSDKFNYLSEEGKTILYPLDIESVTYYIGFM